MVGRERELWTVTSLAISLSISQLRGRRGYSTMQYVV